MDGSAFDQQYKDEARSVAKGQTLGARPVDVSGARVLKGSEGCKGTNARCPAGGCERHQSSQGIGGGQQKQADKCSCCLLAGVNRNVHVDVLEFIGHAVADRFWLAQIQISACESESRNQKADHASQTIPVRRCAPSSLRPKSLRELICVLLYETDGYM